jgi:hypothetical protein
VISESKTETSITKTVSVHDIPEVMNFIASKRADYKFVLDDSNTSDGMNRSHEDNLVMTELITDEIIQVTNAYQKSNYTFRLIKQSDLDGKYFLNLVVKEYKDSFYLYIVKYVPDTFWLSNHSITKDLGDFTGMVYFYSDEGIYVANVTMQNGNSIASERHPCDEPEDDGNNGGGDDIGGGGSGCTMTMVWYECNGTNSSIPHSAESCGGSSGGGSGFYWVESGDCVGNKSMNDFLRHPCEGSGSGGATGGGNSYCQPDPDCVFPMQLNENCDCAEPEEIENGDVGVVAPNYGKDINICLGNNFTVDEINTLNENSTINQLYNYMFDDFGNCNPENPEFAELAAEALLEGGEVDYEEQIINELEDKALCVYNKLISSSTGFKNAIKKFEPEFPVAHLKFDMGDIGTSRGKTIAPNSNPATPNSPDFVITVRLNNNSTSSGVTQRPNLLVAKTIAHEVIHAEMYRKLLSVLDNGGNIDGVTRQDVLDALDGNYPGLYDYYRRHKNWQHAQMATHYRETLARILQEYNTGTAVPDNQQPEQLYMDLAWEGLIYENPPNAIPTWTDLPQTEKDRIESVIADYISENQNETCTE